MNTEKNQRVKSLDISHWHKLGIQGVEVPVTICLEGDSMRPMIRRGVDPVTIVPLNRPVQLGDVVLFQSNPERYVVHRVQNIRGTMVRTLGDHCAGSDPWMPKEHIWGLVTCVRRGKRIIRLDTKCSRWAGRMWMALLPVRNGFRWSKRVVRRLLRPGQGKRE